jgi:predicted small integral membrane protein
MPRRDGGGASSSSLAFVAYALVPYLGILFCPGALLCGGVGLWRSRRSPHAAGRRDSALGLALGLLVLCAQLLLWWVLYKVPEWSRGANF